MLLSKVTIVLSMASTAFAGAYCFKPNRGAQNTAGICYVDPARGYKDCPSDHPCKHDQHPCGYNKQGQMRCT
ncbi:unnamed protein product [Zymoseptoria tritici ST99CH_3D1]|nr:unnamed protein product [Zymoseptoria tritici ST99CH_3D1]